VGRSLIGLILGGLVLIAWVMALGAQPRAPSPPVSAALAVALSAVAAAWLAWMHWASGSARRWSGGAALALLLAVQLVARGSARSALRGALPRSFELVSLASTPLPGNPLCWSLLAVQRSQQRYVVTQATASGWPGVSSAARCAVMNDDQTAPLKPSSLGLSATDRVVWGREFRAPLAELASLRRDDCIARAFLRFARVPFWIRSGERFTLVGDLRFDRSSAVEFAELPLVPDAPCPRFEPPWLPPLGPIEAPRRSNSATPASD
jgi:hypothetical protein